MESGGKSVMFTGDSEKEAGEKILRIRKETGLLKCDICQMSHHGKTVLNAIFMKQFLPISVCAHALVAPDKL
jgi:beta-lactamase superfamily II metal-dependent hydrolase